MKLLGCGISLSKKKGMQLVRWKDFYRIPNIFAWNSGVFCVIFEADDEKGVKKLNSNNISTDIITQMKRFLAKWIFFANACFFSFLVKQIKSI